MKPSTEWAAMVTATMNKNRIPYSAAWQTCRGEHPDWWVLVSASGRSAKTVEFFNSREVQKITPEREDARKQFSQFVNEKMNEGLPYQVAFNKAAREHPEVYAASHSNQGLGHVKIIMPGQSKAQFSNDGEMPAPIFSPQLKYLFWLPTDATKEEAEAAWTGNGSVTHPLNPAKIFAALVGLAKAKNSSLSNDAAIAQVKARASRLWEAVTALSNEPI
jgi:hypothetical protein